MYDPQERMIEVLKDWEKQLPFSAKLVRLFPRGYSLEEGLIFDFREAKLALRSLEKEEILVLYSLYGLSDFNLNYEFHWIYGHPNVFFLQIPFCHEELEKIKDEPKYTDEVALALGEHPIDIEKHSLYGKYFSGVIVEAETLFPEKRKGRADEKVLVALEKFHTKQVTVATKKESVSTFAFLCRLWKFPWKVLPLEELRGSRFFYGITKDVFCFFKYEIQIDSKIIF